MISMVLTEHQGQAAPPCPSQLLIQGKAKSTFFSPCTWQKGGEQFPETKDKVRSRCCRHSMKIDLALRSTPEKVQNYHKVTKTARPNSANKADIQEVLFFTMRNPL